MKSVANRIKRVFQNAKADVLVIGLAFAMDSNFLYMTDLPVDTMEGAFLIIKRKGMTLLVNQLDYEIAEQNRPREMKVVKIGSSKQLVSELKKHLEGRRVGINGRYLPQNYFRFLKKYSKAKEILDQSDAFAIARTIKDNSEIAKIKKANLIVKGALREIPERFRQGMTERQLAAEFDCLVRIKGGLSIPGFASIVSFDKNAALPHHMPDDTKLKPNSIVLLDVGVSYKNYCSDVTRTFIFKPDRKSAKHAKMIEIYGIVKGAQQEALKAIKPGASAASIHNIAADYINKAAGGKYKGTFIHSLGHSLGIDVHDGGIGFSPGYRQKLKAGMVITDEPGIYVVGFGGVRIEDDVLVTKTGAKIL